jgi:cyclophilin family peptidyl-prolyl cis-trans isomerase/protein-disulfide isomerase
MRRVLLSLFLLLAACSPSGVASPTAGEGSGTSLPSMAAATPATPVRLPSTPTALLPFVLSPGDWARGPQDAPVTLVVYSDFQSPDSHALAPVLTELEQNHPDDLRVVYRQFPLLDTYDKASLAAQAAEAAGAQGAFWAMHDLLFSRWDEWVSLPPEAFQAWLVQAASDLGLDVDALGNDLESGRYAGLVQEAFQQGVEAGVPGVPFIYINGDLFQLGPTLLSLEAAFRLELLERIQYDAYPPFTLDPDRAYLAHLELNVGEVVIQLYPESAPLAVNSFLFLAREGWYNGNPVYAVFPGMLIETGDPSGTGIGGPGFFLPEEIDPALRFDRAGMVGLSSLGPGTGGSRFFISLAPLPYLDGTRTILGRVSQGLEVLQSLAARDPMLDLLQPPEAFIRRVTIEGL